MAYQSFADWSGIRATPTAPRTGGPQSFQQWMGANQAPTTPTVNAPVPVPASSSRSTPDQTFNNFRTAANLAGKAAGAIGTNPVSSGLGMLNSALGGYGAISGSGDPFRRGLGGAQAALGLAGHGAKLGHQAGYLSGQAAGQVGSVAGLAGLGLGLLGSGYGLATAKNGEQLVGQVPGLVSSGLSAGGAIAGAAGGGGLSGAMAGASAMAAPAMAVTGPLVAGMLAHQFYGAPLKQASRKRKIDETNAGLGRTAEVSQQVQQALTSMPFEQAIMQKAGNGHTVGEVLMGLAKSNQSGGAFQNKTGQNTLGWDGQLTSPLAKGKDALEGAAGMFWQPNSQYGSLLTALQEAGVKRQVDPDTVRDMIRYAAPDPRAKTQIVDGWGTDPEGYKEWDKALQFATQNALKKDPTLSQRATAAPTLHPAVAEALRQQALRAQDPNKYDMEKRIRDAAIASQNLAGTG